MKKILSLLTVSVLGVTSITNVTAFSQAKTTYKNINTGYSTGSSTGGDGDLNLKIQLNASGWNHLLVHKSHFTINDKWGFGAYLLQYADDNEFHHTWGNFYMPDVPDAVKFKKSNIIEKYFVDFGDTWNCKSYIAEHLFSNEEATTKAIQKLYNLYYNLKDVNITTGVIFTFKATFSFDTNPAYILDSQNYKII